MQGKHVSRPATQMKQQRDQFLQTVGLRADATKAEEYQAATALIGNLRTMLRDARWEKNRLVREINATREDLKED